jgi:heterodisulfide reductase subunit B
VDDALAAAGLSVSREIEVRHPLDVIVNDIGIQTVALRAERRLGGLKIAPYYGCQLIQPEGEIDEPDWSTSMDDLFAALGAESIHYPARTRCCGGMLMAAYPEVGPELTGDLFDCAIQNGADVIATACPLCQINLEDHQRRARDRAANGGPAAGELPVFFFTQLLGIALGEHFEDMDLHRSLVPPGTRLRELAGVL